jgi:Family of unknown function (DUF6335)
MAKRKTAGRKTVAKKAVKKAAKKAAKRKASTAGKAGARGAKKPVKKAPKRTAKAAKKASRKAKKAAPRKVVAKKATKKAAARKAPARRAAPVLKKPAPVVAPIARAAAKKAKRSGPARAARPAPIRGAIPSSLEMGGGSSAAKSGRVELLQHIKERTETSPAITAGDVDADWQLAYSSGDEAPGGDNPTPDQDIVDEIGEALGVNYEDGEELKGAAKIEDRDKHRWELDPASKDDFEDS